LRYPVGHFGFLPTTRSFCVFDAQTITFSLTLVTRAIVVEVVVVVNVVVVVVGYGTVSVSVYTSVNPPGK